MNSIDAFVEVFEDIRFPYLAADLDKLCAGIDAMMADESSLPSQFAFSINVPREKRVAFVSSMRGLMRRIDVPDVMVEVFARALGAAGLDDHMEFLTSLSTGGSFSIAEVGNQLVWEEESLWPVAYSTFLQQFLNLVDLHRRSIEQRIATTAKHLADAGWGAENVMTLSEYPRQLPTHCLYAAASLGAWIGGAINFQYFSYYAAVRQIHHASLNISYATRIGFTDTEAKQLTDSGLIALPASLVLPLLRAQGTQPVIGSIPIDEPNATNQPEKSFFETRDADARALPGFILDKYYRTPFRARRPDRYGFYGTQDVLRDHYEGFCAGLSPVSFVRCKHYCAPVIQVSSVEEARSVLARIPTRHEAGVFFRGQRKLFVIQRDETVKQMFFADSCSTEPSLCTAASREPGYDYDFVHSALKHFLEQKVWIRDRLTGSRTIAEWRNQSVDPLCKLDLAILALSQHYGLPSHGLDITTSDDVALWFATNHFRKDKVSGHASYAKLNPGDWPSDPTDWPVIVACQAVTHSIQGSLHDCHELTDFGFHAKRPVAQHARFFQGGHSDHQNRIAEAVVCVLGLAPGDYPTAATFESLFPPPGDDPAYVVMLEFAECEEFGPMWGKYINQFHYRRRVGSSRLLYTATSTSGYMHVQARGNLPTVRTRPVAKNATTSAIGALV